MKLKLVDIAVWLAFKLDPSTGISIERDRQELSIDRFTMESNKNISTIFRFITTTGINFGGSPVIKEVLVFVR